MLFDKKRDSIVIVIHELFKVLKVQVTINSIEKAILQHPAYPSVFSITNSLTHFEIPNKAATISKEQLEQLETPFLAVTKQNDTVLVKTVESDFITYFSEEKGWVKSKIKNFLSIWNTMVILVDTNAKIKEANYTQKRNLELVESLKIPLLIVFIILVFSIFIFSFKNISLSAYFIVKGIGLVVALILVKKEISSDTEYSFCKVGKKINCNDVLNSPAAKIFRWFSVTDLVFLYFSSTYFVMVLLLLVESHVFNGLLSLLIISSLAAIPFTLLSLFYQGISLRKWCSLCLAVSLVIWLESLFGYFQINESITLSFETKSTFAFVLSFSFISIFWMFLKTKIKNAYNYNTLVNDYFRLTNNINVFDIEMSQEVELNMDIQDNEIVIGNEMAKSIIIVALNPFCPACEKEFQLIKVLLNKYPNFAKVILRFSGSVLSEEKEKMITSAMLISHYLKSPLKFQQLLTEWFEIKNFNLFIKKYPIEHNELSQQILKHHYEWSDKVSIEITPTTFFNSKKIPPGYSLDRIIEILRMNE